MHLDRRVKLFVILAAVFVTALVVGDIISVKLVEVHLGPVLAVMSVGMLPFPITFLLTDILNEFYGKRAARYVTLVGFAMALFAIGIIYAAIALPWAPLTRGAGWTGATQPTFDTIFGGSQRILFASVTAYLVGQLIDIFLFNRLKRLTRNRHIWLRATGSTVVSQLVDTVVVQQLAWTGLLSQAAIWDIVFNSYFFKVLIALSLTPVIYAGHALLERRLGMHPVVLDANGDPVDPGALPVEPRPRGAG